VKRSLKVYLQFIVSVIHVSVAMRLIDVVTVVLTVAISILMVLAVIVYGNENFPSCTECLK
jgi:hypothetical protein